MQQEAKEAKNMKERLKEIIKIADKLKWITPPKGTDYPLMQLSEVEKCMLAMTDDFELARGSKCNDVSKQYL